MNNEIKNKYKVGGDEVFEFKPTSHNSDELLSVFDEEVYVPTTSNTNVHDANLNKYRQMMLEQNDIFLRDRQQTAIRQRNNIATKSIGTTKRTEQKYRKRKSNVIIAKKQKEVITTLCTIFIVAGLSIGTIKTVENVSNFVQTQANVNYGTNILKEQALNELCLHDLATVNERGKYKIKENTITDYRKLDASSDLDVYIYRQILPPEEFDKFIKSVSYNNGYNYYIDFYQFLNINGYYAQGTNTPSSAVFNNIMEEIINNKTAKLSNGDSYSFEEHKSRGGI